MRKKRGVQPVEKIKQHKIGSRWSWSTPKVFLILILGCCRFLARFTPIQALYGILFNCLLSSFQLAFKPFPGL